MLPPGCRKGNPSTCWRTYSPEAAESSLVCDCGPGFVGVRDCHSVNGYLRQQQAVLSKRASFGLLGSQEATYAVSEGEAPASEDYVGVIWSNTSHLAAGGGRVELTAAAGSSLTEAEACRAVSLEGFSMARSGARFTPKVMLVPSAFGNGHLFPSNGTVAFHLSEFTSRKVNLTADAFGLPALAEGIQCMSADIVYHVETPNEA